jgi:ribosomal protein S18 acetylase RimI-like enzyme
MFRDQWIRFTWDLEKLPSYTPKLKTTMRLVETGDEELPRIWEAVSRSYSSDLGWNIGLAKRLEYLDEKIHKGADDKALAFIVLEDGPRVVGASVLVPKPEESEPHFLSGVCVVNEYRCRGYGTALLHASLKLLADRGQKQVRVVTKSRTAAEKHLYPKFGSVREVCPQPGLTPDIRA